MAPVVKALKKFGFEVPILCTAQHRHLLDQMMDTFGLEAEVDLDVMTSNQSLAQLTGKLVPAIAEVLDRLKPEVVLAQGDTTTVFCTSLAAYFSRVPFGHVEAGLRSGDLYAPFPEEGMRRLAAVTSRWHFAPTPSARVALLREGVDPVTIRVVGNTVIDALLEAMKRPDLCLPQGVCPPLKGERLVLVTLHRRENFGEPMARIFHSLVNFARTHPEARFVYPVHPNPQVSGPAHKALGGVPNITLIEPVGYLELVALLSNAYLVLTDSGGLQEEGPALGKPVLVFRDVTERPESVDVGGAKLVGSDPGRFLAAILPLWEDPEAYKEMAQQRFPYGDGRAAERIAQELLVDSKDSSRAQCCPNKSFSERLTPGNSVSP